MEFPTPLLEGRLLRRYKRFLADIELPSGEVVTAHTANPGRMLGLTEPGRRVYLTHHDEPHRKLKYSWRLVRIGRGLVGVDPSLANDLVDEALARGRIPELGGYGSRRREVKYGARSSRVDFVLDGCPAGRAACYVEVKNVSLVEGQGALFPDAVTERGRKHLLELTDVAAAGQRAVTLFVVQRPEPSFVAPAEAIDPAYAEALRAAVAAGVEVLAYRARVSRQEVRLSERLPVRLDPA